MALTGSQMPHDPKSNKKPAVRFPKQKRNCAQKVAEAREKSPRIPERPLHPRPGENHVQPLLSHKEGVKTGLFLNRDYILRSSPHASAYPPIEACYPTAGKYQKVRMRKLLYNLRRCGVLFLYPSSRAFAF